MMTLPAITAFGTGKVCP